MNGSIDERRRGIGWVTVMACLTRYEAWPITGLAFAASVYAWWRRGEPFLNIVRAHAWLALFPVLTVAGFLVLSRITVGEWFVSGGFFVPDDTLTGNLTAGYEKIAEGTTLVAGSRFVRIIQPAVAVVIVLALWRRERAPMLVPLALFGAAALPVAAYYAGHPFRLRYEIPLILAGSVAIGLAIGQLRGWAKPAAALVFLLVYLQRPPFDPRAPMLGEAQLDTVNSQRRTYVTGCLQRQYDGTTIMVSMGSLGHYMHELSHAGFEIKDFLHEGNGPIWDSAFTRGPAPLAGWVLVEEAAEGGDAVSQRRRLHRRLLERYERVCEGGNVALYRRRN
jgi:hypothetical protein